MGKRIWEKPDDLILFRSSAENRLAYSEGSEKSVNHPDKFIPLSNAIFACPTEIGVPKSLVVFTESEF
jgi:hypothetical protein